MGYLLWRFSLHLTSLINHICMPPDRVFNCGPILPNSGLNKNGLKLLARVMDWCWFQHFILTFLCFQHFILAILPKFNEGCASCVCMTLADPKLQKVRFFLCCVSREFFSNLDFNSASLCVFPGILDCFQVLSFPQKQDVLVYIDLLGGYM